MVTEINSTEEFYAILQNTPTVVIDFTATWCGPCRQMAPKFEALANTYLDIKFYKVDVDKCDEVSQDENVEAMPTFRVYVNGKQRDEVVGADEAELKSVLQKYK